MAFSVWARALLRISCAKRVTPKIAPYLSTSMRSNRICCRSQCSLSTSPQAMQPGAVVIGGTNPKLYKGPIKYHAGQSDDYWMMNVESIAAGTDKDKRGWIPVVPSMVFKALPTLAPPAGDSRAVHWQDSCTSFKVKDDCSNMDQLSRSAHQDARCRRPTGQVHTDPKGVRHEVRGLV